MNFPRSSIRGLQRCIYRFSRLACLRAIWGAQTGSQTRDGGECNFPCNLAAGFLQYNVNEWNRVFVDSHTRWKRTLRIQND
jgi:hypothetical protein